MLKARLKPPEKLIIRVSQNIIVNFSRILILIVSLIGFINRVVDY
jgi:hypothetical protein